LHARLVEAAGGEAVRGAAVRGDAVRGDARRGDSAGGGAAGGDAARDGAFSGATASDGAALADWIARHVACPDTMVDRIVPATTDADRDEAAALLGVRDAWPVPAEPFTQWVIERRFAGEAPPLDAAGVQLVDDVAPWEAMKLRLLNAAHSSLSYLGAPAGIETVDAAIAEPRLRAFVERLWREAAATLPASVRGEAPAYGARLLARFANPALHHRLLQIAQDGSRKLPQRLVATLRDARRDGLPHDAIVVAVAAWIRYCSGTDERGGPLPLDDPLAARLRAAASTGDARATVRTMLAIDEVFGDAAADEALGHRIALVLDVMRSRGALGTLEALGSHGTLDALDASDADTRTGRRA
jgi:fructuronate reductase